jgi:hypothetical protein
MFVPLAALCSFLASLANVKVATSRFLRLRPEENRPMQETQCMCSAVFCGHALGEKCPRPLKIVLKISAGTYKSGFSPQIEVALCYECWLNFQRHLPGLFSSELRGQQAV